MALRISVALTIITNFIVVSSIIERLFLKIKYQQLTLTEPFMMTQIIQNAVKYSARKSEQIVISLYERNGEAIFEVTDFGIGIPEEDRRRIFNAFYTGKNGRQYRESTGMGLYLVKEVADYLGHRVEMKSIVGEGTSFRIVFPPAQNITSM